MSDSPTVYCRLLRDSIPTTLCATEQGQPGCNGCTAPTRLCETCKAARSTHPKFGLCEGCLQSAIAKNWCERCRKARRTNGPLCQNCWAWQNRHPGAEVLPRGRGREAVDVAALLNKVELFTRSATSTPAPRTPVVAPPTQVITSISVTNDTFVKDSWYHAWSWNADKDPERILRSHLPLLFKPRPVHPRPPVSQALTLDVWVDRLNHHYCDIIQYDGVEVALVQDFRKAMPVDQVHMERFILDPRIILLTHRRSRKLRPSAHCVVCTTAEEARFVEAHLFLADPDDLLAV